MEHFENLEMLYGLRHDALIKCDYEQHQVNASDTGQHIFYKLFVAGNINDPDMKSLIIGKIGKAQFDRDSPLLLFL